LPSSVPPLFPYTTLFRSWNLTPDEKGPSSSANGRRIVKVLEPRTGVEKHDTLTGKDGARLDKPAERRHRGTSFRTGKYPLERRQDRKSTRLNSSHVSISY